MSKRVFIPLTTFSALWRMGFSCYIICITCVTTNLRWPLGVHTAINIELITHTSGTAPSLQHWQRTACSRCWSKVFHQLFRSGRSIWKILSLPLAFAKARLSLASSSSARVLMPSNILLMLLGSRSLGFIAELLPVVTGISSGSLLNCASGSFKYTNPTTGGLNH